jgi:hypothetical protein
MDFISFSRNFRNYLINNLQLTVMITFFRVPSLLFCFISQITALSELSSVFSPVQHRKYSSRLSLAIKQQQSIGSPSSVFLSETGNKYVLANSYASEDCANDDGLQLFESMATLSGYCIDSSSITSQRWTCDSSSVHVEEFDVVGCNANHRVVDTYVNIDQCFKNNSTSDDDFATNYSDKTFSFRYSCSSALTPSGQWYTSMYYTDKMCSNALQGVSLLNGYCFSSDLKASFMYDNPNEVLYLKSTDCTGASTKVDMSTTLNQCIPMTTTVGSANSVKYMFVNQ